MRGLSQLQLASKTGLKQVAISFFETGRRSPSLANLKRLADALEVTSDYLVGRSNFPEMTIEVISHMIRDERKLSADEVEFMAQMAASLVRSKDRWPQWDAAAENRRHKRVA